MNSQKTLDDLLNLAEACCASTITDDELATIDEILHAHPEWQEAYCQYLLVHVSLRRTQPSAARAREPVTLSTTGVARFSTFAWLPIWLQQSIFVSAASIGLAAALFYGTFALLAWNLRPDAQPTDRFLTEGAVAFIGETTDAQWSPTIEAKSGHAPIHPNEPLEIISGTLDLELNSGTKLAVEGPANWFINDDNAITLNRGRLVARVPHEAIGFTIYTPTAQIVDLGTEFGVEVDESGTAEVHVFKGRVAAQFNDEGDRAPRRVELKASEAARFEAGDSSVKRLVATPERFQQEPKGGPQSPINQPDSLPGLQLWLKADAGVYNRFTDDGNDANDTLAKPGDRVQGWRDFSGHARHALQADADHRPTLQLNTLGSPVLRFDGTQWLERSGVVLNPADPSSFTIMVAFEAAAIPPAERAAIFGQYSQAGDTSRYFAIDRSSSLFYDEFRPLGGYVLGEKGSVATNVLYIGAVVRDGDARTLHLATFDRGTVASHLNTGENYGGDSPTLWRVGTRWHPTDLDAFRGEVSELMIYDRALSQSERRNVENYLAPKLFFPKPQTAPK